MRPDPTLEIRNLAFATGPEVPKHWHGGGRAVTAFFDNLSVFFPVGERFFMDSVRAHRKHVEDPKLLDDIRAFCGQEGMHGREHRRYNRMLATQGYPVEEMEASVDRLLRAVRRVAPKRWQLAATCALEHFTALMGHFVLSDPAVLEGAHPEMAALWRWHSAEETEHKAVAFDVYLAANGHDLERGTVMALATLIFWAKVAEQQLRMMATDDMLLDAKEWRSLFRFLFVKPGVLTRLAPHYLAYYRPGFHPWDLDDRPLLERWKAERGMPDREEATER